MPPFLLFLENDRVERIEIDADEAVLAPGVVVRRAQAPLSPGRDSWFLFADETEAARLNGAAVATCLSALDHKDQIETRDGAMFFVSFERVARVEAFPGETAVACSRCRLAIAPGAPAVRCTACDIWCDESESSPCWTYDPKCPACGGPTALGGELEWNAEEVA